MRHTKMNMHPVVVAEWLRRWTRNPLGFPRAGSNPANYGVRAPFGLRAADHSAAATQPRRRRLQPRLFPQSSRKGGAAGGLAWLLKGLHQGKGKA